jgi:hypothetical protein
MKTVLHHESITLRGCMDILLIAATAKEIEPFLSITGIQKKLKTLIYLSRA